MRQQFLGGCTVTLALFTAGLEIAGRVGIVSLEWLLALLWVLSVGVVSVCRSHRLSLVPARECARIAREAWSAAPILAVTAAGLVLAGLAAFWLPVWQWDALGYHLPFVNFVLQEGGFHGLPRDVPYLSTYPHNIELLFVALRALLPDDRLIDLGQLPLGLVGACAVGGIARELGAGVAEAVVAGSCWLLVPAVYLQLPTNYVDVGAAAYVLLASFFLLGRTTRATLLATGAAIGLFLGTKPSAPPAAALLAVVLLWRGFAARRWSMAVLALVLAGALGSEAYVTQWLRHGNPVWPATLQLGPLHLPGTISVTELLSSGANTERLGGPLVLRVLRSWFSCCSRPAFDMRVGGLGPVFWPSLPLAIAFVVRDRHALLAALLGIAVVTPDPAVARYVLPFPGLTLAVAAALLSRAPVRLRRGAHWLMASLGLASLVYQEPGLTGEGPPLLAYTGMSWRERRVAVGALGRPVDFVNATDRLAPGEVAVFDGALALPYLMWRGDLTNRVLRLPDDATEEDARQLVTTPGVRLVAVAQRGVGARAVTAVEPVGRFVRPFGAAEHCEVYFLP